MELMKSLPAGSVDAIVTDPPYGLGDVLHRPGNTVGNKWAKHYHTGAPDWDTEVCQKAIDECLRIAKYVIVWGGFHYRLPPSRGWLVWDRLVREWTSGHCDLAWTNIDQPIRAHSCCLGNGAFNNNKEHPTQKPLSLMTWCVQFLPEGITVLDPFCGSGTTGVACVQTGRNFIGFELNPKYCEIARRRISEAVPLWAPEPKPKAEEPTIWGEK